MGLFDIIDFVGSIFSSAASSTAKNMAKTTRDIEREHPDLSDAQREKLDNMKRQAEKMAAWGNTTVRTSASYSSSGSGGSDPTYLGKTVDEWNREWKSIGFLKDADLSPYNHCVGLYRHVISGKTMYVGRAIELHNGGFRKRLSDYRRNSNSARKHTSGRMIHEHLDEIQTYILVVGSNEEAVEATKKLEGIFIGKFNPPWNKMINI